MNERWRGKWARWMRLRRCDGWRWRWRWNGVEEGKEGEGHEGEEQNETKCVTEIETEREREKSSEWSEGEGSGRECGSERRGIGRKNPKKKAEKGTRHGKAIQETDLKEGTVLLNHRWEELAPGVSSGGCGHVCLCETWRQR